MMMRRYTGISERSSKEEQGVDKMVFNYRYNSRVIESREASLTVPQFDVAGNSRWCRFTTHERVEKPNLTG